MNTRQQQILEAIIREHQKTSEPVASQVLFEKYNFDLSPATIRSEMLALDEEGLLLQPYHSAGRVPTTKAYRLFVNRLLERQEAGSADFEKVKRGMALFDPDKDFSLNLAQFLADFSQSLGLSGSFGEEVDFHGAGLPFLLEDPEFDQPSDMLDILRGFDSLEKQFIDLFEEIGKDVEVFIGEENPIDDLERCSLVISGYKAGAKKGFVGILGPKRMNYARNIFLVEQTKKVIENN